MINIGKINQLKVVMYRGRRTLGLPGSPMVLLADKKPPQTYQIGDSVTAFVYIDGEAILRRPCNGLSPRSATSPG